MQKGNATKETNVLINMLLLLLVVVKEAVTAMVNLKGKAERKDLLPRALVTWPRAKTRTQL